MPGLRSADSYRTWADLRDVLFEIVSIISYHVGRFTKYGWLWLLFGFFVLIFTD